MNREIKFRAWDKAEGKMNTTGIIGSGSSAEIIYIGFGGKMRLTNLYGLDYGTKNPAFDAPEERFILMQYTGLKDKNGKDIYEGDILDFNEEEWGGKFKPEVITMDSIIGSWRLCGSLGDLYSFRQVIGNIYENPELVKP